MMDHFHPENYIPNAGLYFFIEGHCRLQNNQQAPKICMTTVSQEIADIYHCETGDSS